MARPRSASSDLLLADSGDGGVDVTDDRGLGEPVATKVRDRGEEDGAVETLEVLAAVPQLHHLPTVVDGSGGKGAPALRRWDVANGLHDCRPLLGRAAGEEREPQERHVPTLGVEPRRTRASVRLVCC